MNKHTADTLIFIKLSLFFSSIEQIKKKIPPPPKKRSLRTVSFSLEAEDCVCATPNTTEHPAGHRRDSNDYS